ncbi:MAG: hypothetical protein ACE5HD_11120 [Acidobacteriota bacterium]
MRQDSLLGHIWERHSIAVMARSRSLHERVDAMVASDPPLVPEAIELMARALAGPPSRCGWGEAVEHAWEQLKKDGVRNGYRHTGLMVACKKGRDEARLFLFEAAAVMKNDKLIASSLLDDNPMPGFAFYRKGNDWWQVREKNRRLSCLPLGGLLARAASSARRDAVLHGEGILRRVAGNVFPDPRFAPTLRAKGLWDDHWAKIPIAV